MAMTNLLSPAARYPKSTPKGLGPGIKLMEFHLLQACMAGILTGPQIADRGVALEKIQQSPYRRAPGTSEVGIAVQHEPRIVAGDGDEIGMSQQVRELELRQAALPRTQDLAGAAKLQVLFGDAESILGFPEDREALLCGFSQRLRV